MITPKYPPTGTTIFTVMSALANKHKAINLSQGFPDFPIDEKLGRLVGKAIQDGYNQYAPMIGLQNLRETIANKVLQFQNVVIDPDTEITITPGATYGIYTAFATILQPGDEVVVLEPAYDSYIPNIYSLGAVPVRVALTEGAFMVDWDKVNDAISSKTKAIIINNPHNPCGVTWTEQDFQQLIALVEKHNLYVVSDEVYEHLVFDGKEHVRIANLPGMWDRTVTVGSAGSEHITYQSFISDSFYHRRGLCGNWVARRLAYRPSIHYPTHPSCNHAYRLLHQLPPSGSRCQWPRASKGTKVF